MPPRPQIRAAPTSDHPPEGLVCDLDGVVYRGEVPIEGAADAIAALRLAGVRIVFCTNNSTATVAAYCSKLADMGVPAEPEDIVTSAVVTGEVLAARGLRGQRALVIGEEGLRGAVAAAGLIVADGPEATRAAVVAIGLDLAFDYSTLRRAAAAVRSGAMLVAANADATLPLSNGQEWPGAGSILAAVEVATGRKAEIMGKPHAPMMDVVAARLGGVGRVTIVGDRPETDLRAGAERGWKTVLVLSGVTSAEQAAALDPAPDLVLDSLADFVGSHYA
jgi:phosphoglycolate/pyridoxal phosphate phosphatase family enzyme